MTTQKGWEELIKHSNDSIQKIELGDATYLGTFGVFMKICNGQVYHMDQESRQWVKIEELSLN